MTKFKKLLLGASVALSPVIMLAEGATPAYDTVITETESALKTALSSLAAPAAAVVVAGIAIWLIPRVVSALKSAFTAGKGR